MPWFLVAFLFLIWAKGIYDGRFGKYADFIPDDYEERSLQYLDISLRLEEIAKEQPPWIKWTLFSSDYQDVLTGTHDALVEIQNNGRLTDEGQRALAIVSHELEMPPTDLSSLDPLLRDALANATPDEEESRDLAGKLAAGNATWWDAALARLIAKASDDPVLDRALARHDEENRRLFSINLISIAAGWLLTIIGLIYVPHAIRVIRSGWTSASLHRPVRYSSRWDPSLVIALLISADLIAGYFLVSAYVTGALLDTGFIFEMAVDTLWRVMAPAIALVILFRKPRHAIRSLGLNRKPDWKLILGVYALISWINVGYYQVVGQWVEMDPTGGLNSSENGLRGLFFALLSACIIAPVAEEIFYRGILYRGLGRRFGFWISAGVSTVAFMLAHSYDVFGLLTIGLFGFAQVIIYRATGSLTTTIMLHVIYNLMITLPTWLVYQRQGF